MSEDALYEMFKNGTFHENPEEAWSQEAYNPVCTLRDVIEAIRQTSDPDGDAGEFGYIDPSLEIMYELAPKFSQDVIEDIIQGLFDFYIDDSDDDEYNESLEDDFNVDENDVFDFDCIDEAINMVQKKRLRYLKKKRRAQLGKKANSQAFKRSHKFDSKKKKFVKRDKTISVSAMRKKARIFKKTMKKGSSKAKAKRMKKRLAHVKNPYGK